MPARQHAAPVNPTEQPVKKPLVFPEPVPDSEEERTKQATRMLCEIRDWGPAAWNMLTTFEAEVETELTDGKATTRVRFKVVRDAYDRIKKKLAK